MPEEPAQTPPEPNLELPRLFGPKRRAPRQVPSRGEPEAATTASHTAPDGQAQDIQQIDVAQPRDDVPSPPEDQEPAHVVAPSRSVPAPAPSAEVDLESLGQFDKAALPPGPSTPRLPSVPGRVAAVLTGVVVGLFGTALTYLGLRGCQALKGTSSCGGTGVLMLVVIVLLMGFLGGVLLRLWRMADARATSFLGVGLLCVIVLIALLEQVFSVWMFLAVPLVSAVAYAIADWVTTRFLEPTDSGPTHDVR